MKCFFVIVFLLVGILVQAQPMIGGEEARATAEQFVLQQGEQSKHTLTLSEEIKSETSGQTNLFVFAIEPKGYVIVSALNEVLAYSLNTTLPTSVERPDHIVYWLDLYNEQTDYLIEHPDQARKPTKNQQSVGPLLTSAWGQGCFHNAMCPNDEGPCHHVEAGCVAVAMAQIMYYHEQPINGTGSMTYSCPPYGTLSANFDIPYSWEQMVDILHENNSAVAQLIYHCGVSVKTKYSAQSSAAGNSNAAIALRQFFYYPTSTLSNRTEFDEEEWLALIKNDLDQGLPVYYSGKSDLGGHAFVCDGYDNNGLFHFNFGWDGNHDGYYSLNSPYGFSAIQSCIHNIIPIAYSPIQSDSHGIIYVSPEGSGNGSSWENATSDLQSAIYKSTANKDTIWVKEGIYIGEPTKGYAYSLYGYGQLYGGFKGDEPYDYDLALRDFDAHPSSLDGNHTQGLIDISTESSSNNGILLDGFIIQNGNTTQGGGIRVKCQAHIRNCKFRSNVASSKGGALLQQFLSNSGKVIIENCEFFDNEAGSGGGIYDGGDTQYLQSHIHNNSARQNGGGILISGNGVTKHSQFTHCIVNNNLAQNNGGGLSANANSSCTFWSCLICNNTAQNGGGVSMSGEANLYNCTIVRYEALGEYGGVFSSSDAKSQSIISNCIIWGNVSPDGDIQIGPTKPHYYCAVQNDDTESNFNAQAENDGATPTFYVRFRNPDIAPGITGQGGDWRLQSNSLCINKGTTIANQTSTDLDDSPRLKHGKIDLGAYESDVVTHIVNAYYCEDEPYYYQDSLLSGLGSYTFLFPSHPYDSLLIIQMQEPPPTVFINEEICENESYDFFGTILNESGQYTSTERCVTYKLRLIVNPLDSISMKEEICEGEAYNFFGEILHEAGHYSTIVGCKKYELDLTINPMQSVSVFMEEEICEGESYNFFGRALRHAGYYSTTLDCTTYNLDLDVKPLPEVQCSNDTLVEYGNLVQLYASGADSYLWSTGDTTQSITVYPITERTYTVRGFSKNGCSHTASVTVRVSNEIDDLALYPNPANNKVEIYMPLIDEVEVFNLLGTQMEHVKADRKVIELDTSAYPSGIYVVHIRQLNNHTYAKLIIQH